jgi:solute carrier family 25 uncoupling protein 8/9
VTPVRPKYRGLIGTASTVVSEEGVLALYNGMTAGLHRQIIFSGIRVSLYQPVRDSLCGPLKEGENPRLW